MKERIRRLLTLGLAVTTAASFVPTSALAKTTDSSSTVKVASENTTSEADTNAEYVAGETETILTEDYFTKDSDELFSDYVDQLFKVPTKTSSKRMRAMSLRTEKLNSQETIIYNELKAEIVKIANGESGSSIIKVPVKDFLSKTTYTEEELKKEAGSDNPSSDELFKIVESKIDIDQSKIVHALICDLPYDFYWFDKGNAFSVSTSGPGQSGSVYSYDENASVTFYFPVSKNYSQSGNSDTYVLDTKKTSTPKKAAEYANSIVEYAISQNLSIKDALKYFNDQICDLVSYDESAKSANESKSITDTNPWQMIYVFDKDSSTNVVCEGYSKAFKYLCDRYKEKKSLSDSQLDVFLVSGMLSGESSAAGAHMWNVVRTYDGLLLVDVTNSDDGMIGNNGSLFMAKADSLSFDSNANCTGYTINCGSSNVVYAYDNDTLTLYERSELKINEKSDEDKKTYTITVDRDNTTFFSGGISYRLADSSTVGMKLTGTFNPIDSDKKVIDDKIVKITADNISVIRSGDNKYTFTMPGANVALKYSIVDPYTITTNDSVNGSFSVSATKAAEGDTLLIKPSPNNGYEVDAVTITDESGNTVAMPVANKNGTYTFTMPKTNATVSVTFKSTSSAVTKYAITTERASNGTISLSDKTASEGETVTVTPTPNEGYELNSLAVTDASGNPVTTTKNENGTYTFAMPAGDVKVSATFAAISYSITAETATNGTITVNETSANIGDKVTITASPNTGYEVNAIKVTDANNNEISVKKGENGTYTFKMPASNVKVSGSFSAKSYSISANYDSARGAVAVSSSAEFGSTVNVTVTPKEGYKIVSVSSDETTITENGGKYIFTMPAKAVTVKVVFEKISYSVTTNSAQNGSFTTNPATATVGETVTVTSSPNTGYEVEEVNVTDANGNKVDVAEGENGTYTFKMPASNATVSGSFRTQTYAIRTDFDSSQGSVTTVDRASYNDDVEISVSTKDGYKVSSVKVGDSEITEENGKYVFKMPNKAVTVKVTFAAIDYNVNVASATNGSLTVDQTTATVGSKITITPAPEDGYEVDEITIDGATVTANADGIYTFEMPASDVTVSGTFKAKEYSISTTHDGEGTVNVSLEKASVGKTVEVTATPEKGYEIKSVTSEDATIKSDGGKYTFTMPAKDVSVKVVFAKINYEIRTNPANNGTFTIDKTTATVGETVKITPTPNEGYEVDKITVTGADVTANGDGTYSFVMPASSGVFVDVKFKVKTYDISTNFNSDQGSVEVVAKAGYGDNVNVTVTPKEGYKINSVTADKAKLNDLGDGRYNFTMPADKVTISVDFDGKTYSVTNEATENGTFNVNTNTAKVGDLVKITPTPAEGYVVNKVTVNGEAISFENGTYSFRMPAKDATIEVTFKKKVLITSITIPATREMTAGDSDKISATIAPEGATNTSLAWTSSDPSVATVDQNGTIKALKKGTTTITATATDGSGIKAECAVTVEEKKSTNPTEPDKPTKPDQPTKPDHPTNPSRPSNPSTPTNPSSGKADSTKIEDAKKAAKEDLAKYKDAKDYRTNEQGELSKAIGSGNKAIDAATDEKAVEKALAGAKAAIDNIKTDAQLTAEEKAVKEEAEKKAAEEKAEAERKAAEEKAEAEKKAAEEKKAVENKAAQEIGKNNGVPSSMATTEQATEYLTNLNQDDVNGSLFNLIQAGSSSQAKKSIKLTWKKLGGATHYVIYGNKCGRNNHFKYLKTTTSSTLNIKKLNKKALQKGTYYKFLVLAVDDNGNVLATSKTIHVATKGGKYTNASKITIKDLKAAKKALLKLKVGSSYTIKTSQKKASASLTLKNHRGLKYESSNKNVAKVTSKGKIKGINKGTCYVYVYAQDGVRTKVKVTVK